MLDWSSRLKKDFDLHVLEFSERAAPLDRPGDLSQLKPDGQATSLTKALGAAARPGPAAGSRRSCSSRTGFTMPRATP